MLCSLCNNYQKKVTSIYSCGRGKVRDLNYLDIQTHLWIGYRLVKCSRCGHVVEELGFVDPEKPVKVVHKDFYRAGISQRGNEDPLLRADFGFT